MALLSRVSWSPAFGSGFSPLSTLLLTLFVLELKESRTPDITNFLEALRVSLWRLLWPWWDRRISQRGASWTCHVFGPSGVVVKDASLLRGSQGIFALSMMGSPACFLAAQQRAAFSFSFEIFTWHVARHVTLTIVTIVFMLVPRKELCFETLPCRIHLLCKFPMSYLPRSTQAWRALPSSPCCRLVYRHLKMRAKLNVTFIFFVLATRPISIQYVKEAHL